MRFLVRLGVSLVTAALGILVASLVLPGFTFEWRGLLIGVVVFAGSQAILGPFVFNLARQYASAVLGGIGLVTTFLALLVASFFPGGIQVDGIATWIFATLVVWIITALGGWILPLVLLRDRLEKRK